MGHLTDVGPGEGFSDLVSSMMGSVRTMERLNFVSWPGAIRASVMEKNRNSNTTPVFGAAYFETGRNTAEPEAEILYPYDPDCQRRFSRRPASHYARINELSGKTELEASNGGSQPTKDCDHPSGAPRFIRDLPSMSQAQFHVLLRPNGNVRQERPPVITPIGAQIPLGSVGLWVNGTYVTHSGADGNPRVEVTATGDLECDVTLLDPLASGKAGAHVSHMSADMDTLGPDRRPVSLHRTMPYQARRLHLTLQLKEAEARLETVYRLVIRDSSSSNVLFDLDIVKLSPARTFR